MPKRRRVGRPYRRARLQMFALYGTRCWICGHPGAGDAGHIKALAANPNQPMNDPRLWRPVHGSRSPCQQCGGRSCNQEQGTADMAAVFKPKLVW